MSKRNLQLFDVFEDQAEKDDVGTIIQELKAHCTDCRLGFLPANKNSKGFFSQGDPGAKIAVLADYPYPIDILMNKFLEDGGFQEWQRWILSTGLKPKDLFHLYVIQCRTAVDSVKDQKKTYRIPNQDEINRCFPSRALKALQAMPNLEVVLALGPIAAKALLGGEVTKKSHEGLWFGTDLLPGVAVYCLPHPRDVAESDTSNQRGRALQLLEFFRNEYLSEDKKILGILSQTRASREAERKKYVL